MAAAADRGSGEVRPGMRTIRRPAGLGSTRSALKRHQPVKITQYYRIYGITAPREGRDLLGRPDPVTMRVPVVNTHSGAWLAGPEGGWKAMQGHSRSQRHARRALTACLRHGGDTRPAHSGNRRPAAQQLPAVTAHAGDLSPPHSKAAFPATWRTRSGILRNAWRSYPQSVDGCGDKLQSYNSPA